jgi:hypothetical protein
MEANGVPRLTSQCAPKEGMIGDTMQVVVNAAEVVARTFVRAQNLTVGSKPNLAILKISSTRVSLTLLMVVIMDQNITLALLMPTVTVYILISALRLLSDTLFSFDMAALNFTLRLLSDTLFSFDMAAWNFMESV